MSLKNPITFRSRLGLNYVLKEQQPVEVIQVDLGHHHIASLNGVQHRLDHHHLVPIEDPAHIHAMARVSSGARFDEDRIRGARKAAGLE